MLLQTRVGVLEIKKFVFLLNMRGKRMVALCQLKCQPPSFKKKVEQPEDTSELLEQINLYSLPKIQKEIKIDVASSKSDEALANENGLESLQEALKHKIIILSDTLIVPNKEQLGVRDNSEFLEQVNLYSPPKAQNEIKIDIPSSKSGEDNELLEKISLYSPPKNQKEIKITDIPSSRSGKSKKYFCLYCNKLFSKLPLHLERAHSNEVEVREFMMLPKGTKERKDIIDVIRKKGAFKFNTDAQVNDGHLIVTRRPQPILKKREEDYRICPSCKGLYSKLTIRKHYPRCMPFFKKGDRTVSILSKRVRCQIHIKACPVLRDVIFPVLRDDKFSKIVRYDPLIICYGNSLCKKYRLEHLQKMIRAKIRLLGRFLVAIKQIDSTVTDFASIYVPAMFETVISAVNIVAQLNEDTQEYKSPSTAFQLGTTLKKCGKLLITEYIKDRNEIRKHEVEDFLKIFEEEFSSSVNKTVGENQLQQKRKKQNLLPSINDIAKFNWYLEQNVNKYYNELKNKFNFNSWKNLASYTLVCVQIFNRRRAGEAERITIEDFNTFQSIDDNCDPELFQSLPKEYKTNAKKYVRFVIRGKKGRPVPVLLSISMYKSIKLILRYREQAGVPKKNPYVFGIPGRTLGNSYLSACSLMRKFSKDANIINHNLVRGTQLRKQIATQSAALDLNEIEVGDLANFLGHAEKIHREHYRLPIVSREIGRISQLLEMGVGKNATDLPTEQSLDLSEESNNCDNGSLLLDTGTEISYENECCDLSQESNINEIIHDDQIHNCEDMSLLLDSPKRDSWTENDRNKTTYNKQRCVSPYGTVKRTSWSTSEKETATDLFKDYIKENDIPSLVECSEAIKLNSDLKNRTPKQLKAWIANQINKKRTKTKTRVAGILQLKNILHTPYRIFLAYWSTEEKDTMKKIFKRNLEDAILPSLTTCSQVLKENPVLKNRTDTSIKAWINNQIRKRKTVL